MPYRRNLVFAAACAGMLMFGIALLSMGSLLPSITARFPMGGVATGALVSILPFGVLAGSVVFGPVVDRFGYKLLLTSSALTMIAGLEGLAYAASFDALRLSILAIGFGGGILNGGTNALVADISVGERGAKLTLLGVFFGIGALGMPAILGALSGFGFTTILQGIGAVLLLPALYFAFIAFPVPKQARGVPLAEGVRLVRDGGLMLIALTLLLESSLEGVVNNWTTTYLQQARGVDPHDALFALTAFVGGMTLARLALGWLLKVVDGERVLLAGLAVAGVGIAVLAIARGAMLAGAGLALVGIGLAAAFPLLLGYVADLYPAISGTAFSLVLAIALLGNMAINYLVGVLFAWHGAEHLPLWQGLCLALEIIVAVAALRAHKARVRGVMTPG